MLTVRMLPVAPGDLDEWLPLPTGSPVWQHLQTLDDDVSAASNGVNGRVVLVRGESGPDIPRVEAVSWVTLSWRIRRVAAGAATARYRGRIRSAGVDWETDEFSLLTGDGSWHDHDGEITPAFRLHYDPATNEPWTWPAVLAAQFGVRDSSTGGAHTLRLTWTRKSALVVLRDRAVAVSRD